MPSFQRTRLILLKIEIFQDIFYSRKNFLQPDKQPYIHRAFEKEADILDTMFKSRSFDTMFKISRWTSCSKVGPWTPCSK
ncbi:hypothetical protein DPMN_051031 [Dreissena polymorpha]|uniref:Uncharacterized protein n=1 Tax=Dreissena polymorpha TaxID=45954 RepID=A0A9D4CJ82_DREPO|nr:hypothetical protein DPMN_051031 [Dreissena polymorpha]